MENRWTLHIRELGKIQEADITPAPLTLFAGDNNSGKSYLMAILYALLNIRFSQRRYDLCNGTEEYVFCADWLAKQFRLCEPGSERRTDFGPDVRKQFGILLNNVLEKNLGKLARDAFNTDVSIGSLSITLPDIEGQELLFKIEPEDDKRYTVRPYTNGQAYTRARTSTVSADNDFLVGFILEFLIKAGWKHSLQKSIFLPTSRTGFLLTYRSLISASIANAYDTDDGEALEGVQQLTRPCSDFLKNLTELSPAENKSSKYGDVVRFIESKMMHGQVSLLDSTPQSNIYYRPDGADLNLPMHLASGVVTELAPLLLMLKYSQNWQVLFMEEPEIGLHPALQAEMARMLIRIWKCGTPVFVTTHSDTILQGLNNSIKFGHLPEKRRAEIMLRHDHAHAGPLSENDVAMYQFDVDPDTGRSKSKELAYTEYGFRVPTFNDALSDLLEETRELEKDAE